MNLTDMHIHALSGVDDGPKSSEETIKLIDASYADGIRTICLTPHYHPGFFGDNAARIQDAYVQLRQYTDRTYPDLELYLGNELRYSRDCLSWLADGMCLTMNNTRYVLVDFTANEEEGFISAGLYELLNAGYVPVLAHVERYNKLAGKLNRIAGYNADGVVMQIDAQSLLGKMGWKEQRRSKEMLSAGLADIISSDAHDIGERPHGLKQCYEYIAKKYGKRYADALCSYHAQRLLKGASIREETEDNNGQS